MKRLIAEWLWRAAIVCALGWIGWGMHQIRVQMQQPDDEATTAAAPADLQDNLDELSDGIAKLNEKVDAMMVAMLQLTRLASTPTNRSVLCARRTQEVIGVGRLACGRDRYRVRCRAGGLCDSFRVTTTLSSSDVKWLVSLALTPC